ncbi:hypothetical protein TSUD_235100 [Trifolium subterraneum]|uniref:Uncharacterized protein n=1 Tax=Trifolium subterraneum TaxID=3900 RepID=A0A2Z6LWS3_TRISU|nr:hypothetical protein TSUD_235100 [Trifolium subterraneum]
MEDGSRVLLLPCNEGEESMKVFREGIGLAFNFWWRVRWYVKLGCFEHDPLLTFHSFCDCLFSCFIRSKHPLSIPSALRSHLVSFFCSFDNTIQEFSDQLVAMYQECLQGDFSSIHIIKEANARPRMWRQVNKFEMEKDNDLDPIRKSIFRHVWQTWSFKKTIMKANLSLSLLSLTQYESKSGTETPSVEIIKEEANVSSHLMQKQANSSEMDGSRVLQGDSMRVFKEGLNLFVKKLWVDHVFVKAECGSNSSLMLQDLADDILFWFTQTITKKLMVMYEECLESNFSSVEILREESLSWASCSILSNDITGEWFWNESS